MKTRIKQYHFSELSPLLCETIAEVNRTAFAKYIESDINMRDVTITADQLLQSLKKNDETVFLLYEGDSLMAYVRGAVAADSSGTKYLQIEGLATVPQSSGKGYGTALLKITETWAKEQGACYVRLDTSNRAVDTRNFYHSRGFLNWYYRYLEGRNYISIYMRKDYGAPYPAYRRLLRLWATYLLVRSLHTEYGRLTLFGRFIGKLDRGFKLLKSKLGKH